MHLPPETQRKDATADVGPTKTEKTNRSPGQAQDVQRWRLIDVGKQTALHWISSGVAWIPEGKAADLLNKDCGIFALGDLVVDQMLGDYAGKVAVERGAWPTLPWAKTMVWNPRLRLRKELVPIGFHLLDTWQVAIPIDDYDVLASQVGSDEDRVRTMATIRDLRVPMYTPDLLFVKRCGDTERLLEQWRYQTESFEGGDPRLALLRALYVVKPLVLALPTTWVWKNMDDLQSKHG